MVADISRGFQDNHENMRGTLLLLLLMIGKITEEGRLNETCLKNTVLPWTCGDTFICGGTEVKNDDDLDCCNTGACNVTTVPTNKNTSDTVKIVTCPGTVKRSNEHCNNKCLTPTSYRNRIIGYFCDKNKCMRSLCEGRKPYCEDKTDLKICQDDNIRNKLS